MGCVYVECANEARCGRFHIKPFYMHATQPVNISFQGGCCYALD